MGQSQSPHWLASIRSWQVRHSSVKFLFSVSKLAKTLLQKMDLQDSAL